MGLQPPQQTTYQCREVLAPKGPRIFYLPFFHLYSWLHHCYEALYRILCQIKGYPIKIHSQTKTHIDQHYQRRKGRISRQQKEWVIWFFLQIRVALVILKDMYIKKCMALLMIRRSTSNTLDQTKSIHSKVFQQLLDLKKQWHIDLRTGQRTLPFWWQQAPSRTVWSPKNN